MTLIAQLVRQSIDHVDERSGALKGRAFRADHEDAHLEKRKQNEQGSTYKIGPPGGVYVRLFTEKVLA